MAAPQETADNQQRSACCLPSSSRRCADPGPGDRSESLLREGSDTSKNQLPYKSAARQSSPERAGGRAPLTSTPAMPSMPSTPSTPAPSAAPSTPAYLTPAPRRQPFATPNMAGVVAQLIVSAPSTAIAAMECEQCDLAVDPNVPPTEERPDCWPCSRPWARKTSGRDEYAAAGCACAKREAAITTVQDRCGKS